MKRWQAPLALLFFIVAPIVPAVAQSGGDDTCPSLVETALQMVAESCTGLNRDEACYGHNRVDATFWQPRADLSFSQPADRVPLLDLRTISTAPLDVEADRWGVAVLHARANVPDTLPGQAVTFLLMGDATLESAVPPEQAAQPVEPVAATASTGANLRSRPSTNANVVGSVPAGSALPLIGVSSAGDWYQVALDDGSTAWVFADLVTAGDPDALAALPVTDEAAPTYGPMQAVYFTTGLGDPACAEAPNALVVQSPQGVEVALRINDLDVQIGSTVVFTAAPVPDTDQQALVAALVEGRLTAPALNVRLEAPGDAFAVTLNDQGRVDDASRLVELPAASRAADAVHNACQHASQTALLIAPPLANCGAPVRFTAPARLPAVTPAPPPIPPGTDPLAAVGPADACTVAAVEHNANLRSGPGIDYTLVGQLAAGQTANPDGYADSADGFRWWRLGEGSWVRSDLIRTAGNCEAVAVVEAPEAPEPPPPGGGGSSRHYLINNCEGTRDGGIPIRAGELVRFATGCCGSPTVEEQQAREAASGAPWITFDGAPVSISITGIFWAQEGWYTDDGYYDWVATPGTHTVSGSWGSNPSYTCTFNVE